MNRQDTPTERPFGAAAGLASVPDFAKSQMFERAYREGMSLVEEAAFYLDGPGREESRDLPRTVSLAYAGESMRLTTRLMQVAAWLLVKKAVREGELSPEEAAAEKYQLGAREVCMAPRFEGSDGLPGDLLALMDRSERLYERVARLDALLRGSAEPRSPLEDQLRRVEAHFSRG